MIIAPKVSVIVPIYKVEKYLRQCIDSILNQTLKDIEIILVDDGSPDNCPQICDEYAAKDPRVKVIHQQNGGAPRALNHALTEITGKYSWFVDADDYITPDAADTLFNVAEIHQTDVVIFGGKAEPDETLPIKMKEYWAICAAHAHSAQRPFSLEESAEWIFSLPTVPWNRFYRSSFLHKYKLCFDEDLPGPYDFMFNFRVLLCSPKMLCLKKILYHYRLNPASTTASLVSKKSKNCLVPVLFFSRACNLLAENQLSPLCKKVFFKRFLEYLIFWYNRVNKKQKKEFFLKAKRALASLPPTVTTPVNLKFSGKERWIKRILKHSFIVNQCIDKSESFKNRCRRIIKLIWQNQKNSVNHSYFLFGKKIYSKTNYELIYLDAKVRRLEQQILNSYVVTQAQQLHPQTFGPYKQIYEGRSVVLVATGPSAQLYQPVKHAIHVGVNGAVRLKKCKLDYLFVQDYASDKQMNQEADSYIGKKCKKFYGIHPFGLSKRIYPTIKRIPQSSALKTNAYRYLLEEINRNQWAYDPSIQPLGNFESTVFSALQFILYTHPRTIYLVGCDCSLGYFYEDHRAFQHADVVFKSWQSFKQFSSEVYPDIEIISINPVRLKGMFKDQYSNDIK